MSKISTLIGNRVLQISLLVFINFSMANTQNNPACKAKTYQCNRAATNVTISTSDCVVVADIQEKTFLLQACTEANTTCDHAAAKYNTPATCMSTTTVAEKFYPGEACTVSSQCHSSICDTGNGICEGKKLGFKCTKNADCVIGTYCHGSSFTCAQQSEFDQVPF
jgi:hypothetical protein